MFDNLFAMMGPVCSSAALATVLVTVGVVVGIAKLVGPNRRIVGPRF